MAATYDLADLEGWDARIREKAEALGLDCFPQEFEVCDHNQMLGYMAYSGMPSHYPHWSYGKSYEKLKTLYDHGVSGLPYEMVINSNPALAYLMRDNTLLLQILTIAHVYGHNDFFKNNFTFQSTRPEYTIGSMKAHGNRVRGYFESPSIGIEKVEHLLDAAHALSLQCRRNLAIRKLSTDEQRQRLFEAAQPAADPFQSIHRREAKPEPDLRKVPPAPEDDLLLFLRDHNTYLAEWEKDLLTIVHEEAQYFLPQIETKIMNEGWASYWHKRILDSLELPQELHLEFIVRHNQVVRPFPGGLNPYHLGFKVWEDIHRRYDDPTPAEAREIGAHHPTGDAKIFEVREVDRDISFLRRHLTAELIRELNLFEYQKRGDELVVSRVADEDGWREVKETLLQSVGMGGVPVIKVEDADFGNNRTLHLVHYHDGRDLQVEYAERTLAYVHRLWARDVALETSVSGKKVLLTFGERGFASKQIK
ncbi:MAG: SpoVR family protein [Deltaproteobacteria bacterium]|nr:SpoVR family protein [Deltaproteobacteria bacterium]